MKKCPLCGGGLEDKKITHPLEFKGRFIIVEGVPAEVCQQCGEVLLRPNVLEYLQQLAWSETAPRRTARVPVYDMLESIFEPDR